MMTPEEKRAKHNAKRRAYYATPAGRAKIREQQERYLGTPDGRAAKTVLDARSYVTQHEKGRLNIEEKERRKVAAIAEGLRTYTWFDHYGVEHRMSTGLTQADVDRFWQAKRNEYSKTHPPDRV
jgi:hypothetical protein